MKKIICFDLDGTLAPSKERLDDEINDEQETHKVMLHFKLNILSHNDSDLNLNDFLLLFNNSDRCCSSSS